MTELGRVTGDNDGKSDRSEIKFNITFQIQMKFKFPWLEINKISHFILIFTTRDRHVVYRLLESKYLYILYV